MGIQKYLSQVVASKQVSAHCKVVTLHLESPKNLVFQAGQHVIMDIPGIESKRSYSIASTPSQTDSIDLLIDTRPAGPGSKFLASVHKGDVLTFLAPAGQFVTKPYSPTDNLVFIATGSGICPLKSMITDILEKNTQPHTIQLLWGLRQHEDAFWLDAFNLLKKTNAHFSYTLALSQSTPSGPFLHGRVTDHLKQIVRSNNQATYYLCGSKEMITAVVEQLGANGVTPASIQYEKFY
jgi:ferredoxin-NADP reductase